MNYRAVSFSFGLLACVLGSCAGTPRETDSSPAAAETASPAPGSPVRADRVVPVHGAPTVDADSASPGEPTFGSQPLSFWIDRLGTGEQKAVFEALAAVTEIGPAALSAVPALADLIRGDNNPIALRALTALEAMGVEANAAAPALVEVLSHAVETRRDSAARVLEAVGAPALPALLAGLGLSELQGTEKLVPALVSDLGGEQSLATRTALALIGEDAVPALVAALSDAQKPVRQGAARTLTRIGNPEANAAVPALLEAFRDRRRGIRPWAGGALAAIGEDAVPGLTELLGDNDTRLRLWTMRALVSMGPAATEAIPAVAEMLGDENKEIRHLAARLLSKLSQPDDVAAVEVLARLLLSEDREFQLGGAAALSRMGSAVVPALLEVSRGDNVRSRAASLAALCGLGTDAREALGEVVAAAEDPAPEVRRVVADGLPRIAPLEGVVEATLHTLAVDEDSSVTEAARRGLEEVEKAKARGSDL